MTLESDFEKNLEEWRKHLEETIHSSNHQDYINCDAYRDIVAMGTSVLPLIKREYEKSIDHQDMEDPGGMLVLCYQ